jgi:hypothetical protein
LPTAVVAAINRKIEQYYIAEEYKFRVAREMRESERKKIEADGISEFQRIVSQGISPSYLRWRGIEATHQLAQSSNPKIVIIGSRKDGSPIILGNVDTSPAPSSQAPVGDGDKTPKERTTAATPTVPSEKTPADTLSKPSEKVSSAQPSEARRVWNPLPLTLSDIKAFVSRLTGGTPASSEAGSSDANSKKLTSEQQQKAQ